MPKKEINLLPKEEFGKKPLGKFLVWALGIGRWIVIITELVVILAFLARFKLDRDIANLYDSIRAKQAIITTSASFEEDFRFFQNRLIQINRLTKNQLNPGEIIDAVAAATPPEIALNSLSVEKQELRLSGLALSETSLKVFTNTLSASSFFSEIALGSVGRKLETDTAINFNLTAKIKTQSGEK